MCTIIFDTRNPIHSLNNAMNSSRRYRHAAACRIGLVWPRPFRIFNVSQTTHSTILHFALLTDLNLHRLNPLLPSQPYAYSRAPGPKLLVMETMSQSLRSSQL